MFALFGIIIYTFYILYDSRLIYVGENRKIEKDEYILGSVLIYTDIINIFTKFEKKNDGKGLI